MNISRTPVSTRKNRLNSSNVSVFGVWINRPMREGLQLSCVTVDNVECANSATAYFVDWFITYGGLKDA